MPFGPDSACTAGVEGLSAIRAETASVGQGAPSQASLLSMYIDKDIGFGWHSLPGYRTNLRLR